LEVRHHRITGPHYARFFFLRTILGEVTEPLSELGVGSVIVDQLVHEVPTMSTTPVTVDTEHREPAHEV